MQHALCMEEVRRIRGWLELRFPAPA